MPTVRTSQCYAGQPVRGHSYDRSISPVVRWRIPGADPIS